MTRDDLILFAAQNGYLISDSQIERWHKKGILPAPEHLHPKGVSGSLSVYPETTKDNLKLLLTSEVSKRNLDELFLDVWLRGGNVELKNLRKVITGGPFSTIEKLLKSRVTSFFKFERMLIKYSERKGSILPYEDVYHVITTFNVLFSVLSPNTKDRIWGEGADIKGTGELSAVTIAHKVIGIDEHEKASQDSIFDEMKTVLNVKTLRKLVENADEKKFDNVRKDFFVLERIISAMRDLEVYKGNKLKLFWLIRYFPDRSVSMRSIMVIVLLAINDRNTVHWANAWKHNLDLLETFAKYCNHMKKHPKLKKRTNWIQYFGTCPLEELLSIRSHHNLFCEQNPSFLQTIAIFESKKGEIIIESS
ncbi:hypothetical protein L1N85_19745 [Paenibacillus alkaliterrae]|uniref:hypothetical protein n=1 Tax=Paenibacillus alkaliterrae TaxID=320909 RepID=UPI001F17447B|nr:hypothetical protein [Paenibacillus alkaliterrae]MCF2940630.1 hypothetical protein [Paenibacillus alkaliterrae]